MLKSEVIKGNEALKDLTVEQVSAIETLSENDENTVIGARIGKVYGDIDADITSVLGIEKPKETKTYDWLKADILPMVSKSKEFETQVQTLTTEKTELERKIAAGANVDPELKRQLDELNGKYETLQGQYKADTTALQKRFDDSVLNNTSIQVDSVFNAAKAEIKFSDQIPATLHSTLFDAAKAKIKGEFTTDFIDDGKGGKVMVYKTKEGLVHNNPTNGLHPYTTDELLRNELKDSLAVKVEQTGTGTKNPDGTPKTPTILDLSAATTQVKADEIIHAHILSTGITTHDPKFQEEFKKIRVENKISEKPMK